MCIGEGDRGGVVCFGVFFCNSGDPFPFTLKLFADIPSKHRFNYFLSQVSAVRAWGRVGPRPLPGLELPRVAAAAGAGPGPGRVPHIPPGNAAPLDRNFSPAIKCEHALLKVHRSTAFNFLIFFLFFKLKKKGATFSFHSFCCDSFHKVFC